MKFPLTNLHKNRIATTTLLVISVAFILFTGSFLAAVPLAFSQTNTSNGFEWLDAKINE